MLKTVPFFLACTICTAKRTSLTRLDTRGVENCPIFFSMYNLHSEEYELNQGASKKVDCLGKKQSIVYTMNLKLVSRTQAPSNAVSLIMVSARA